MVKFSEFSCNSFRQVARIMGQIDSLSINEVGEEKRQINQYLESGMGYGRMSNRTLPRTIATLVTPVPLFFFGEFSSQDVGNEFGKSRLFYKIMSIHFISELLEILDFGFHVEQEELPYQADDLAKSETSPSLIMLAPLQYLFQVFLFVREMKFIIESHLCWAN